jgi:positive regulator of sigma E activity
MNRRSFFMQLGRIGALAGLLSLAAFLLFQPDKQNVECKEFNACKTCTSKKNCEKPEAIKFRENEGHQ